MNMKQFLVYGFKHTNILPILVKSMLEPTSDRSLLDVKFEINPLDKVALTEKKRCETCFCLQFCLSFSQKCDQRVVVSARPLQIIYDAETIIQLLKVFKMPQDANLSEYALYHNTLRFTIALTAINFYLFFTQFSWTDAAADKLSNFKERSATGIQYMIEKHTRLEVDISVMPNYVIIPHGGTYIEWVV